MNKLDEFINKHEVIYTKYRVDKEYLKSVEGDLEIDLCNQLKEYLLNYGFLGYKFIEFYGINSRQGMSSDMIKTTKYLHENFPNTKQYIALENRGDGDYILVGIDGNVFEFEPALSEEIKELNNGMLDYILQRFKEIDD